jgi:hypothetical protein
MIEWVVATMRVVKIVLEKANLNGFVYEAFQLHHKVFSGFLRCSAILKMHFSDAAIDAEGMHFTRTKLNSVARFEEPKMMLEVKHFLGLANYFRDHVPNFSVIRSS